MDNVESRDVRQLSAVDTTTITSHEFAVVILAAGLSNRMGQTNKLLLKHNGQSLLQHCVTAVKNAGAGEVRVVLGHDRVNTEGEIAAIDVSCVVNEHFESGQMSSVHCGLNALSGSKRATLICLADQPLIEAQHLRNLMWAFDNRPSDKEIVIPVYQNQRGNPVVISELVRNRILEPGANLGCRRYIDRNPSLVSWVSFDDKAYVLDIDTPDEYDALRDEHIEVGSPK